MSAPRETGSGLPWLDYQVARAASARPTGVPLTADNVADAVECRDADGTHVRCGRNAWRVMADDPRAGALCDYTDEQMVQDAPACRTVVTKWRKP